MIYTNNSFVLRVIDLYSNIEMTCSAMTVVNIVTNTESTTFIISNNIFFCSFNCRRKLGRHEISKILTWINSYQKCTPLPNNRSEISPEINPEINPEISHEVNPEVSPEISPHISPEINFAISVIWICSSLVLLHLLACDFILKRNLKVCGVVIVSPLVELLYYILVVLLSL